MTGAATAGQLSFDTVRSDPLWHDVVDRDLRPPQPNLTLDTTLIPGVALHPAVARWFRRQFGQPTPPQRESWPHIDAGLHTLIAAPTGSGKTLAGFLMSINRLYLDHAEGRDTGGTDVVYVSPLKALAVDIAENLERPLAEIATTAADMGLTAPELTLAIRTGDTTPAERQAMLRRPRTFVVTTPESLYLLLTAAKSRATLGSVRTVIVDEIHALARDKRGAHLTISLERLAHVCQSHSGDRPVRVGLSATQRPIETIARLLTGHDEPTLAPAGANGLACTIVDVGHQRHLDLALELPTGELEAVTSGTQMSDVLDRIAELVTQHRTTLVFVNTRRLAERLAHELGERLDDDDGGMAVAAHHGSLSKDRRHRVERRLRAGELKALVATASLELGIDVGPVELVCQIGSPRAIATFLQRVGRSNHTRHGTPRGRLYPLTRDELVECSALLTAVRAGQLDAVEPPVAPLDILAQQIVAETAAEEWDVDALFDLVTSAFHYSTLDRQTFDRVLELVSEGIVTGRGRRASWVHHDSINRELRGRKGARYVALTSGGAIPEIYDMRVVVEPDETFIGTVNEDWAMESMAGDIFLLGSNSWRIRQVTGGEVRVTDAGDSPPTVPFWTGEAPARTAELSEQVSELRRRAEPHLVTGDESAAVTELEAVAGIPAEAAHTIVAYLRAGRATLGLLPTSTELVMERFFDDADGMQLVIHSPLGARLNRAMGYALRKKFCVGFNFELQAAATDDAVVISLGPHHSFPLADVVRFLRPDSIRETLSQAILDQPAFQSRWRWNLNRSLVVLRMRNGKRNPPPIQRMESDDLLAALFPDAAACQENVAGPIRIPEHPIVDQTIHDTLTEALDVDGLIELWRRIEAGQVTMHCVETTEPSVLAHEILTARPYAFLDDDELPDRRTRAVSLRRGLPEGPVEIGHLLPEVVAEVAAELAPRPTGPDELHDLLRDAVLIEPNANWEDSFATLVERGRALSITTPVGSRWLAAEYRTEVEVLLSGQAQDEVFPEAIAARLVRGHLEIRSPLTGEELARSTGLAASLIAVALATLESEGSAIQGRFTGSSRDTDRPVEWCARRLLARMHHRSRRTRRQRVEPASPEQFVRFLTRWQHVAPGTQLSSPAGLGAVIEQLQGWSAAVAAWEPALLSQRLCDYQPAWIDRYCHEGRLQWLRLAPTRGSGHRRLGPSKATPVTILHRQDLHWMLAAWRADDPARPDAGAVAEIVDVLTERGPSFAADLAKATGRLPTDIEAALWCAVASGLVSADGFEAIRSLTSQSRRRPTSHRSRMSRLRQGAQATVRAAGRWSLVPAPGTEEDQGMPLEQLDPDDLAEAVADQLLQRWGVLFYDLAAFEQLSLPWRSMQWALRRLEDRGLVLGGRFVKGFSGEQFALPAAAEDLDRQRRRDDRESSTITVSGVDPLNLTGIILPGRRTPSRRGLLVDIPC